MFVFFFFPAPLHCLPQRCHTPYLQRDTFFAVGFTVSLCGCCSPHLKCSRQTFHNITVQVKKKKGGVFKSDKRSHAETLPHTALLSSRVVCCLAHRKEGSSGCRKSDDDLHQTHSLLALLSRLIVASNSVSPSTARRHLFRSGNQADISDSTTVRVPWQPQHVCT